jgi:hypothetical protein
MYKVKLESFNGNVSTITLPNKEAVESFISAYPEKLPTGTAIKVSCDLLGIRGSIVGKA